MGWGRGGGRIRDGRRTRTVGAEKEFAVAVDEGVEEGAAVGGGLGRGFAVVVLAGVREFVRMVVRGGKGRTTLADQSSTRRERWCAVFWVSVPCPTKPRERGAYDGANDILPRGADRLDGVGGRAVLQDDLELGVLGHEVSESRQELGLGVHDGHAVGRAAGDFAVQVEDDALVFYGLENVVEGLEREDAPF